MALLKQIPLPTTINPVRWHLWLAKPPSRHAIYRNLAKRSHPKIFRVEKAACREMINPDQPADNKARGVRCGSLREASGSYSCNGALWLQESAEFEGHSS